MAHALIVGTTMSGKTTLAGKMAQQGAARHKCLVFDPNLDVGLWGKSPNILITDDINEFIFMFDSHRQCFVFVDESREAGASHDPRVLRLATRGRHFGHKLHYLGQRAKQVHPDIRTQCAELFCFSQTKKDALELAEQYNDDFILKATELKQGQFIHKIPFQDAKILRIF